MPARYHALLLAILLQALVVPCLGANRRRSVGPLVHTFSIVAFDPEKKEWGVGVASKYLAV